MAPRAAREPRARPLRVCCRALPIRGGAGTVIAPQTLMSSKSAILIVDDEEDSRAALQTILGTWGYSTDAATDGREALDKAAALRPSLVVTDLMMPDMDGLGLLTALQQ